MNTQQLQYFNTIAALENMSKAAELLHVSQSNLSKVLSKLEDEVGCQLFERNGKNIKLNAAGQRFLECSSSVLSEISACVRDLGKAEEKFKSMVKIGIVGSFSQISDAAAEFSKNHHFVSFDVDGNLGNEDILPDINDYDVLIYPDNHRYERYVGYPIFTEKYYLAVPKSCPLSKKLAVNVADMKDLTIVYIRHPKTTEHAKDVLEALTLRNGKDFFVNTRDLHRQMVSSGLACGFVPSGASSIYENDRNIKLIPIAGGSFQRPVKIAFRREKHLSPVAIEFRDFLINYFNISTN